MPKSDLELERRDAKNAKRAETQRRRRAGGATTSGGADWMAASPELLQRAVETVSNMGGALRLGYTRDGGAFAIGIYGDGEPFTEYVAPSADIDEYLKGLIEDYGK